MSREDAFEILATPIDQLNLQSDYYKAVFQLSKYPGEDTENILISLLKNKSNEQCILIAKRKAIEVLAHLGSKKAITYFISSLDSQDSYLVDNAAWALQKIGNKDIYIQQKINSLLSVHKKDRRVLIKALSSMNSNLALDNIRSILLNEKSTYIEKSSSIAAIYNLSAETKYLKLLEEYLLLPNQNDRQCVVQDLIDVGLVSFIPKLIKSPISPSFRLRAIDLIWPNEDLDIDGVDLFETIENIIIEDINNIKILHQYDNEPTIDFLVLELFGADFSRSYLSLKTLLLKKSYEIWPSLYNMKPQLMTDYGALYFVNLLFRNFNDWGEEASSDIELIVLSCLDKKWPEFMKFKPAAILTLMKLYPNKYKHLLAEFLDQDITLFWTSRYAALLSLEFNKRNFDDLFIMNILAKSRQDAHRFVRLKANNIYDSIVS